jgi:hypothetical protein
MDLPDGLGVDLAEELLEAGRADAVIFFTASASGTRWTRATAAATPRSPARACGGEWPSALRRRSSGFAHPPAPESSGRVAECDLGSCQDTMQVECPLRRAAQLGPVVSKGAGIAALLTLVAQLIDSAELQAQAAS